MKLVNVEDLKVLIAVESKGEIRYGKLVTDLFDDISIVEAIPIEWLKSKIDAILDNYPDGNEETEILCKLLYDWKKENEANAEC